MIRPDHRHAFSLDLIEFPPYTARVRSRNSGSEPVSYVPTGGLLCHLPNAQKTDKTRNDV